MNAMPKPKLTEARLRHMQARASRVWRGESQPQAEMAEDILLLVGEVRELRTKVAQADHHTLFPESEQLFNEMNSLFRKAEVRHKHTQQEYPQGWVQKFRDWMWRS